MENKEDYRNHFRSLDYSVSYRGMLRLVVVFHDIKRVSNVLTKPKSSSKNLKPLHWTPMADVSNGQRSSETGLKWPIIKFDNHLDNQL